MAAELPGAAFLQRRLARAQAVPPAQRSPEVQAFIASVELGRQACELLPLRQGGAGGGSAPQPALQLGDPATARMCGGRSTTDAGVPKASSWPCRDGILWMLNVVPFARCRCVQGNAGGAPGGAGRLRVP